MNVETRREFLVVTGCTLGAFASLTALGCRAGGTDASPNASPTSGGSTPGAEEDAAKPATTPAHASSAVRPFRFDVGSFGGHVMSQDAGQPVHEWASWLRVRSDERRGDLVLTRHSGDMVERPVGWFRSTLDDEALAKLQEAITSTKWNDLPQPQIGDPTANMLRLSYADATTK
ncbi:MAG: hypothetical protein IAG13_20660, partial [Deltaproteobacteria bacterium]|nr:hypothetical protein [Nannocystaceae bacterium]